MQILSTSLLVIGGGPGGYVAAIRAAQLGVATTLVEGDALGGTCLNIGCIPSKALIHAAEEFHKATQYAADPPHGAASLGIHVDSPRLDVVQTVRWKDGIVKRLTSGVAALLKKNGVQVLRGWARVVDGKTVDVHGVDGDAVDARSPGPAGSAKSGPAGAVQRVVCEHLLLATGSQAVALPGLPFGGRVLSATEALSPDTLPERLVVVGGGYIGLELGTAYCKLGVQVEVVEALPRILPGYDDDLARPVDAALRRLGVQLHLGCSVAGWNAAGDALRVLDPAGQVFELGAERVLVAVGRRPRSEGYGLESLRLDMAGPAVKVDDQCRTSMRQVWAIGDLTGEPMLAHRAMAQGETVAEVIAGQRRRFAPAAIPAVCFTDPELVSAGLTPDDARRTGLEVVSADFPFAANGRALTLESGTGFVRVVARRDNHLIVGWQAAGRAVSELAAAFSQSIEMGARLEDVAGTIHAHPTLGEAVQEAALRALGHPLHV